MLQNSHELVEETILIYDLVQFLLRIWFHQWILVVGRLDVVRHFFGARLVKNYALFFEKSQLHIVKDTHLLDCFGQINLRFITQKRLLRKFIDVLKIQRTRKVEAPEVFGQNMKYRDEALDKCVNNDGILVSQNWRDKKHGLIFKAIRTKVRVNKAIVNDCKNLRILLQNTVRKLSPGLTNVGEGYYAVYDQW